MSWSIDSIPKYVINLDRRSDRWERFQSYPGAASLTNLRRWSAVDGNKLDIETDTRISLFTKYNIITANRRSHYELNSKGGAACYMSHVEVWKDFLENNTSEVALIFEDDAIIDAGSLHKINVFFKESITFKNAKLWDFCICSPFGTKILDGNMYPDDKLCKRLLQFMGLSAYFITRQGIEKIMPIVYPIQGHVDWFVSFAATMKIIDVCIPPTNIFKREYAGTDIQKPTGCTICNIQKNDTDGGFVSNWRLIGFHIEEALLFGIILYGMYKVYKK